jgi:hypothetical protein
MREREKEKEREREREREKRERESSQTHLYVSRPLSTERRISLHPFCLSIPICISHMQRYDINCMSRRIIANENTNPVWKECLALRAHTIARIYTSIQTYPNIDVVMYLYAFSHSVCVRAHMKCIGWLFDSLFRFQ